MNAGVPGMSAVCQFSPDISHGASLYSFVIPAVGARKDWTAAVMVVALMVVLQVWWVPRHVSPHGGAPGLFGSSRPLVRGEQVHGHVQVRRDTVLELVDVVRLGRGG